MSKRDSKSGITPAELHSIAGEDPIVQRMIRQQLPLTRETYLEVRWPEWEDPEANLDGELEASIPEPFQEGLDPETANAASLARESGGGESSPPSDLAEMVMRRHGVSRAEALEMINDFGG